MNKEKYTASSFFLCRLFGTFLIVCFCVSSQAQTYYSRDNNTGVTAQSSSWDGPDPVLRGEMTSGGIVVSGYLIHNISGAPSSLAVSGLGTSLVVEDTLRIYGNLSLKAQAAIHIKPNAILIVHGNYIQDANVSFNNQGNAVFLGNWQSGDSPTNTSNTGNLYVSGTFSATGSSITSKTLSQLQTDNASLYAFSRNNAIASVCANSNSGTITFTDPHISVIHWETSTDFFKSQITVVNNTGTSLSYLNLSKTTSFRAYYKKSGGVNTYSDPSTVVVRDIMKGSTYSMAEAGVPESDLMASYSLDGNTKDGSGNENHGTLHGGASPVTDRFGVAGKAYSFDGIDDYVSTTTQYPSPGPQLFSISIWFKTTTTTGGKLIGFGDRQTGESAKRDRHLYMDNNGQIYFGVFPDRTVRVVNTTESYNDGLWHHVVVSLSSAGMELYVDGSLKARNANVSSGEMYGGYWKIGYDALTTWPSEPGSRYFKGSLDDIYIFEKRLSPEEIEMLHSGSPVCEGEPLSLNASSVPGATYSWSGPNGFTSAEQNPLIPSVTTAHEGKYSVTITFDGCDSREITGIKVTPAPQAGNIQASQNKVCTGTNSVSLTLGNYVGSVLRWESSTDDFSSVVNPITQTDAVLNIQDLSVKTSFRAVVHSGSCGEAVSLPATIEVENPPNGGSLSGDVEVCFGDNSGTITLSGHTGTVVRWESSTDGFETDITPIANITTEHNFTNLLQTTVFRALVSDGGGCADQYSSVTTIVVDPATAGGEAAASISKVCGGNNSGTISLSAQEGAVVRWESSTDNFTSNIVPIAATDLQIPFQDLQLTTSFRAVVKSGVCAEAVSTEAVVVVDVASQGGNLSGSAEVCAGSNNGTLSLSGHVGEVIRWESAADAAFSTIINEGVSATLPTELIYENLNNTTYYRVVVKNGECGEAYSSIAEIIVSSISGGVLSGAKTVCEGNNSGTLLLEGYTGNIIRWESSTNDFASDLTTISHTAAEFTFNNLSATTSFRAIVGNGGICQEISSTVVKVVVEPALNGGSLAASQPQVCTGDNSGIITLSGHSGNILRWESSIDNFETDVTVINHTLPEFTFSNLSVPTSYKVILGNGSCGEITSTTVHISFFPAAEGGNIVANANSVCAGNNSGTLSLNAYNGNVLRWEASTDNFQSVTVLNNSTAEHQFRDLNQATSFRAVITSSEGCGGEQYSSVVSISVETPAMGGEVSGGTTVCAGNNAGILQLINSQGTIIRWERSIDSFNNHIEMILETTYELVYANLSQTSSYRAVLGNASCGEVYSSVATIVTLEGPTGGVLMGSKRILQGNNSGTLMLEGYQGDILQWEISGDNFLNDITVIPHRQAELSYLNLESNTWYRVQIGSADCSPVYSQTAELMLNRAPTAEGDEFSVPFGQPFSSNRSLLENDSDPDGDGLHIGPVDSFVTEKGNTVTIDAAGFFAFEFKPGFSGADSFQYQLCDNVPDASLCTTGMVLMEVEEDKKVVIYQGFSPNNGDDKNDKWVIQNIQHYPNNLVQVFNRHGVMVFEMRGYNNTDKVFEGFSNRGKDIGGKELPKDTYYYQIRLEEKSAGLTGFVIINR